jgi:hypothetical protein
MCRLGVARLVIRPGTQNNNGKSSSEIRKRRTEKIEIRRRRGVCLITGALLLPVVVELVSATVLRRLREVPRRHLQVLRHLRRRRMWGDDDWVYPWIQANRI